MRERVLLAEEAAPRLDQTEVSIGDSERLDEVVQLPDEELDRTEVGAALGVVRRAAVPDLVVEDDRAAVSREVGHRKQVVVRRARAAVERDERRRPGAQVALHPLP